METTNLTRPADTVGTSAAPTLQQWLKVNPRRSINDYYREFGVQPAPSYSTAYNAPVAAPVAYNTGYSHYSENHATIHNTVFVGSKKSILAALALTFLLGPLGLFYASIWGALLMILVDVAAFVLFLTSYGALAVLPSSFAAIGLFGGLVWLVVVQWPACMIWALIACIRHNSRIDKMVIRNSY
ncbi:hypothetical protein [Pontibacter sp. HJ8]